MPGPIASTSEVQVGYVAEVTAGTTPTTPAFKLLPVTSDNFDPIIDTDDSQVLDPSGNDIDSIPAKGTANGTFGLEMTHDTFDDFLEALFGGTWTTNVLKNGTTRRSFTLETKVFTNPTPYYKRRTGCAIDSFVIDFKAGAKVTAEVGFEGMDAVNITSIVTGATYTSPVSQVMMSAAQATSITIGGFSTFIVPSMKISFKRNQRPQYGLGSLFPVGVGPGNFQVTVDADIYMTDAVYSMLTNYRANASGATSLTFGSTANKKYTLSLPNTKIDRLGVPIPGMNQDVIAKTVLRGYLNAGIAATASLTRAVA